jgi:hypothetical protein
MKGRTVYTQNRAELDRRYYREGFIEGYQSGAEAMFEYVMFGDIEGFFSEAYGDHYGPEPSDPMFGDFPPLSEQQRLAYRIGYSDAYDLGFKAIQASLEAALRKYIDQPPK